jgi:hypothetical protein
MSGSNGKRPAKRPVKQRQEMQPHGGSLTRRKKDSLIKQIHGGAIYQGAPANPVPGTGRPPSAIREHLRGSFSERIPVLERIADGAAARRIEVPLSEVLPHVKCSKCDGAVETKDETNPDLIVIEGQTSAGMRDRIRSLDLMAKYGLGTTKELTVENVRERLKLTLEILRNELTEDQEKSIMPKLKDVWRG